MLAALIYCLLQDRHMTGRLVTSASSAAAHSMEPAVTPPRRDWRHSLKATSLVVLIGPPAGSLVLSATTAVMGIADSVTRMSIINDLPQAISGWIMLSAFLALFSYIYGLLPTLMSCLWLGWRIYQHGTVSMTESIATAVAAVFISAVVISALAQDFPKGIIGWLLMMGPPAIFSAFVCRRLLSTFGILPLSAPKTSP